MADTPKQTHVGTPRRKIERDPNFYYVLAEKDSNKVPDYESPIESMIDDKGFEIVSEDKKETGHSRLTLLRCPLDEHNARMKSASAEANSRLTSPDEDNRSAEQMDSVKKGAPIALDKLGTTIGKSDVS